MNIADGARKPDCLVEPRAHRLGGHDVSCDRQDRSVEGSVEPRQRAVGRSREDDMVRAYRAARRGNPPKTGLARNRRCRACLEYRRAGSRRRRRQCVGVGQGMNVEGFRIVEAVVISRRAKALANGCGVPDFEPMAIIRFQPVAGSSDHIGAAMAGQPKAAPAAKDTGEARFGQASTNIHSSLAGQIVELFGVRLTKPPFEGEDVGRISWRDESAVSPRGPPRAGSIGI